MLQLDDLPGTDSEIQKQIKEIDEMFALMFKTKEFTGEYGQEVTLIKAYEKTCAIISSYKYSSDPDNMPTIRFFQALDLIKEQNKTRNGKPKNGKRFLPTR